MKIMKSLVKDAVPKVRKAEKAYIDLVIAVFLAGLVLTAGLFLLALLFPEELAQAVQEFAAWFLAATVSALALLAVVKGLEGLLDS